jgi:hypothetical protein
LHFSPACKVKDEGKGKDKDKGKDKGTDKGNGHCIMVLGKRSYGREEV